MQTVRKSDRHVTFAKVAAQLGVEPSYVQRVAAGEVESREVDDALRAELDSLTHSYLEMRTREAPRDGERRSPLTSKHRED
ncbi:MAG: hypothetical protein JWO20_745 [Candidatus Angelobacter sp.]|jgi:hypothetical protein|nr:hypothetical protein [Candidatus Angelobacter sp.]